MIRRSFYSPLFLVLCLIFFFSTLSLAHADILDPELPVTSCGELAAPGTYTLSQNITGATSTCFYVSSDSVTLDGAGFSVSGTGPLAVDARAYDTLGVTLTNGANGYTDLVIKNITFSGFTSGVNTSGNTDTNGSGENFGYGGIGGDVTIASSTVGSITTTGGNTGTYGFGGSGGNIFFTGTNINIASSTLTTTGGTGTVGTNTSGGLSLTYSGTLNKTNTFLSALSYFNDNATAYGAYPGGTWPISPGNISSCGTLYGPGTFTLTQNISGITGVCFTIFSNNVTISGNGYAITSATSSNTQPAIKAGNYASTTIASTTVINFSTYVAGSSSVIITGNNLNFSNQLLAAGSLRIDYTGTINTSSTTVTALSNLTLNGIDYGVVSAGEFPVWVPRETNRQWRGIASSANGTKLAAVVYGGKIYTSTDSGVTWTPRDSNRSWTSITSSADGTKLAAVGYGQQIYTSTDSGVTWTPRESNQTWRLITSSADGIKLAAVAESGQIYTSTDSGVTWTARDSVRQWRSITSSADGTKLAAAAYNEQIYTSTDSGVTWTPRDSNRRWYSITSSADGTKLAAVELFGQIYISSDSGVTWIPRDSARGWVSISSSADGTKLAATHENGKIYVSTDSGISWLPQDSIRTWSTITSSADGTKLAVVVDGGKIYTYQDPAPTLSVDILTPASTTMYASTTAFFTSNWAPRISWGIATSCYYSYNNFVSTTTVSCANGGSDIVAPVFVGTSTLSVRGTYGTTTITKSVAFSYGIVPQASWIARDVNRSWYSITSSADGTKLAAVVQSGQIYTSTDSGVTWTPRDSNRNWYSITSSADGTKLAATVNGGQIYTSTDSGVTWTARDSNRSWGSITSSADGTKLAAVVYSGQIYTSTDSGVTWTARDSNRSWGSITSSADGTKLAAVVYSGQIYTSTDSGLTWIARDSNRNWPSVTTSADGTKLAAVVNNGQIYTSTNSGVTWTPRDSNRRWYSITSSADGTRLVATVSGGQIYTSTDSGITWTARDSNRFWYTITSSADGTKLAAVVNNGQIYSYQDPAPTLSVDILTPASTTAYASNTWNPIVSWGISTSCYYSYNNFTSTSTANCASLGSDIAAPVSLGTTTLSVKGIYGTSTVTKSITFGYVAPVASWIPRDSNRLWQDVTSSVDGTKLAAVVNNGQIYTSTDSGVTWTARDSNRSWWGITSSADGTKLAAVVLNGQIYTSIDSGVTWTPRDSNRIWVGITSSADGTKLAAVVQTGQIYTSTDSGVTWTARDSNRGWFGITSSADGTKLVAVVNNGQIYTSTDSGVTWIARDSSRGWSRVTSSADGNKLAAGVYGGQIYTSINSGVTWTPRDSNRLWQSITSSADGTKLAVVANNGQIYISTDSGVTWTPRDSVRDWYGVTSSADGNKLAATVGVGKIYTYQDLAPTHAVDILTPASTTAYASNTWNPIVSWGLSTSCYYSYNNFVSTSTVNCANAGSDIAAPASLGSSTLYVRGIYATSTVTKSITFGYVAPVTQWIARDSVRGWQSITSSIDGVKLAAVAYNGQIYTSTNSGVTWTARETNRTWRAIGSSADGNKLVAVPLTSGQIYTSTDSGVTWTSRDSSRSWESVTSSADGTKLAAVVTSGQIYTSTDSGVTWTSRDSSRAWQSITSSADGTKLGAVVFGGQIYTSTDSGVTWTPRDSNRNWYRITSSADGTNMAAVVQGGQIYTSTNSGVTWTARDSNRGWSSITSSADGVRLAATVQNGQIFTSTNSGTSWSPQESSRNWSSISSSADGNKLVAGHNGGLIYTTSVQPQVHAVDILTPASTTAYASNTWNPIVSWGLSTSCFYSYNNFTSTSTAVCANNGSDIIAPASLGSSTLSVRGVYGTSTITKSITFGYVAPVTQWVARDSARNWLSVAVSADGTKLAATVASGQIYTSTDSGVTWTPRDSNREWRGISSSADGTKLAATVLNGQIYTSTDSGVTWTPRDSNRLWFGVKSSADGTKLAAYVVGGGQIYTSTDSGLTWTPRDSDRNWVSITSSADGTKLAAIVASGQIYTSTDSGVTWIPRDSNRSWASITSSADGTKLAAIVASGQIYTSTDSGVTWTPRDSNRQWQTISSSADGVRLFSAVSNGQNYTSTDSGVTWIPQGSNIIWQTINPSADGNKLVATVGSGPIYTASVISPIHAVDILIPASTTAYTSNAWAPIVSWGLSTSCYYSYNNFTSTSTANCANLGADITPPSSFGTSTLSVRGIYATSTITKSVSFNFSYTPFNVAINNPTDGSTITSFLPSVSWGAATQCYYSYNNFVSTSTANCLNGGSDIAEPAFGSRTLKVKGIDSFGVATSSTVSFDYQFSTQIITPPDSSSVLLANWSPSVNWNLNNPAELAACYYSYDNFVSTSTADCANNGSDIAAPTSSGSYTLNIKSVDVNGAVSFAGQSSFTFQTEAVSYYYNNATQDYSWDTVANWWLDSNFTIPAGNTPQNGDVVYIEGDLYNSPYNGVEPSATYVGYFGGSWAWAVGGVFGSVDFYNGSVNYGTVYGDSRFHSTHYFSNPGYGDTYGQVYFTATSTVIIEISSDVYSNISSWAFSGDSLFVLNNVNNYTQINSPTIFNGGANYGSIYASSTFNNGSVNYYGYVSNDATFNDSSYNYGDVAGNGIFNDSSVNYGTVYTNAIVNYPNSRPFNNYGSIYGGTIYQGYPPSDVYFANNCDSDWNNPCNWTYNALPAAFDTVHIDGQIDVPSYNPITLGHIYVGENNTSPFTVNLTNTTGDVTFLSNSGNGEGSTINGNATFNTTYYDVSAPSGGIFALSFSNVWNGRVTGTVYGADNGPITRYLFNDSSYINGRIDGNATFNTSYYDSAPPTGSVFNLTNDGWKGYVSGTMYASDGTTPITEMDFYGGQVNLGTTTVRTVFNDSSYNQGDVLSDAWLNTTYYTGSLPAQSTLTLNGSAQWAGTVSGSIFASDGTTPITDLAFTQNSYNDTRIVGSPTFAGNARNAGIVVGNPAFSGAAYSSGRIIGNPLFTNTAPFGFGTVIGTTTLSGISQTINRFSSTTSLVKNSSVRDTLYLSSGSTYTIGNITLNGFDTSKLLTIRSTNPGFAVNLNILGTSTMDFLRLRDIHNIGPTISFVNKTVYDDGGNSGFLFNQNAAPGGVLILDTTPPDGTLFGSNPATIYKGGVWNDPGIAWSDVGGRVISTSVSGTVNPNTIGTYYITYRAIDSSNNRSTVVRTIYVIPVPVNDNTPKQAALNGAAPSGGSFTPEGINPARLTPLVFAPLPNLGSLFGSSTGDTKVFNPFENLQGLNGLRFASITPFTLEGPITRFVFSPLPKDLSNLASVLPAIDAQLKQKGIRYAQDLVKLITSPLKLGTLTPKERAQIKALNPNLTITASSTRLATELTLDSSGAFIETVSVYPNTELTLSLSNSTKMPKGTFGKEPLTFIKVGTTFKTIIVAPQTLGKYVVSLEGTKLQIQVVSAPKPVIVVPPKKSRWLWISKLF